MGQLITTVVGGALGFLIGGPLGAQVGMMLGGMIGATLFGPTIKGPRLNDLKVTASTYGVAIPEVYGSVRIGGNMIWTAGIKETSKTSRAGKGGPKQTTYSYSCSFAMGICKGPIDKITRIWADSKLIYDATAGTARDPAPTVATIFGAIVSGSGKKKKKYNFRAYTGTESQLPDSLIEADKGAGNVSAHRGMCYIVFENMPLEDFGNRVPQMTFEVTKALKQSFPSISAIDSDDTDIPSVTSKTWYPDWATGRLFAVDQTGTPRYSYSLDLNTMKVAYREQVDLNGGARYTYAPGLNKLIRTPNSFNSGQVDIWDTATITLDATYGENSNSLSGYYYTEGPNKGRKAFANSGQIGTASFTNGVVRDYVIVLCGWTKATWIISSQGEPLSRYNAPWVPKILFEGKQNSGQVLGWRSSGGYLQVREWTHYGYELDSSGANVFWTPYAAPDGTVNLQPYAGETFVPTLCLFDPSDDHIFVIGTSNGTSCVFKYSYETNTYKFIRKHVGMPRPLGTMKYSRLAGGTFGYLYQQYRQTAKLIEIDLQNGDWLRDIAYGTAWGNTLYAGQNQHWDDVSSSLVVETYNAYRRIYFRDSLGSIGLASIVSDIAQKSGVLTALDIDTSGLDDADVIGYHIDRECSARDALKQLATAYLFDCYESDYKLCFRSRGNASVVSVPQSWLARTRDGDAMQETITQELEMPLKITLNYYDVTRDHQQGTQSAKRKANPFPTMWTSKEDILDLPITWDPDGAKQCADKLLKMTWANRTGYQFQLPWRYLKYDPTDVITVAMDSGTTYTLRLTEANIGADFVIEAKAVSEKATAYVSTAIGNPGEAPTQSVTGDYTAYPMIINTPLLRDEDYDTSSQSLCYLSCGTVGFTFGGASIFMDDGIEYRSIGAIGDDTISGVTMNALGYTTAYESIDETSILRVRLSDPSMELESITYDTMLNTDANAALVGEEVIQFQNATFQTNGEWWLTGLRRARRGTNYALREHAAGERFLILSASSVTRFARPPESYVTTRTFKAVPPGTTVEEADPYPATLIPRDLMPYTPEDVKITDDGTDVTITMQRRSRIIAPLVSYTGDIHYKEGSATTAKITYKVWPGLTVNDTATTEEASITGNIPLFDPISGDDIPAELTFPLASLGGETKFLIRLTEMGEVEGIPKWVEFERIGQDRWNATDFY